MVAITNYHSFLIISSYPRSQYIRPLYIYQPNQTTTTAKFTKSKLKTRSKEIIANYEGNSTFDLKMGSQVEEKRVIKVAALCGSLRKASFNRGLLRAAMKMCSESVIEGIEMEHIDISELPMINVDLVVDGKFPTIVEEFRQKIREADAIFFASPEYNYSVTPLLKNAIDWASRPPNAWADKPAAIVSVEGSGKSGQYHLRQIGVFLDIHFINKPEFFLNAFEPPKKFDNNGDLIDEGIRERLQDVLLALQSFTLRLIKGKSH